MIRLIIGRRQRGKTTLGYYMAAKCPQLVIFDPRGMIRSQADAGIATTTTTFRQGFEQLQTNDLRELIYTPADDDFHKAFSYFCRCVKAWIIAEPSRPLAVMIDELSFVNTGDSAFSWILRCSDPAVVHVFVTCHRPKDVSTDMRAIADQWFLFQCRQEHDLDVIEERCSPETARAVQKLEGREFVMWDDDKATLTLFKNSGPWKVDLRRQAAELSPVDLGDLGGEATTRLDNKLQFDQ